MESLKPKYVLMIRLEGIAAFVLHATIVWAFGIPLLNYADVHFGFGSSWSPMQYVHHFGTERHVLRGTRDLWLFAPIDWIRLHHNWHLTHHEHPTVPWIYSPQLSCENGAAKRDFLIWHYLRMWRGPRKTDIVCHAAYIAWQLGRTLTFDPVKEEFVGDDEANRMRSREMRSPWTI